MKQELQNRIASLEAQLQASHQKYAALQQQVQHLALDIQRLSGGLWALRELECALEAVGPTSAAASTRDVSTRD